ncbi:hypothetical protein EOS_09565 [Caballeronia mineralivorans PML1(12)]|uniref:Uncharacterized protein n=1 Tax=Caballeronia mineralivorans PML1(12) TaxID=908627 RepID=A0A0J1D113_9BURK|nr:hypothetical protein [Caballeronia mineralivorans]KLU26469.1 hypothetical protein EOS_09565 [Caballeronia mineralivorans PML1(12)]
MRQDIEVGDHLLAINVEQKYNPADKAEAIGFNVRVIVTRHDGMPVRGSTLAEDSGELTGAHGPYTTVADAIAHGESWGRHFVARILGGAV